MNNSIYHHSCLGHHFGISVKDLLNIAADIYTSILMYTGMPMVILHVTLNKLFYRRGV